MLNFFLLVVAGIILLAIYEFIRLQTHFHNEYSRKTYHIVHILILSISPFLISYKVIIVLEILLLAILLAARWLRLFSWLYEVGRVSWGDLFAPVGTIMIAFLQPSKWVFLAAMLNLALADTTAALIGKRYGKSTQYRVFGQTKSLMGSAAFYVVSLAVTLLMVGFTPVGQSSGLLLIILLLPPLVTLAENVSFFGSDNFVIPVVVVLVLRMI